MDFIAEVFRSLIFSIFSFVLQFSLTVFHFTHKTFNGMVEEYVNLGITQTDPGNGIFSVLKGLSKTTIVPLATFLITMVLCYELIQVTQAKNSFHGENPEYDVAKYVFKAMILLFCVNHAMEFFHMIFKAGNFLTKNLLSSGFSEVKTDIWKYPPEEIMKEVGEIYKKATHDIIPQLIVLSLSFAVIGLAQGALLLVIGYVLFSRLYYLYIYFIISPISVITFGTHKWANIGDNHFRVVISFAIQVFLIILLTIIHSHISVFLYQKLSADGTIKDVIVNSLSNSMPLGNLVGFLLQLLLVSIVLIFTILHIPNFSKSLVGTN